MKEILTRCRNGLTGSLYRYMLRPVFFHTDPELLHDYFTHIGSMLGGSRVGRKVTRTIFNYTNPALAQDILGISFKNPVGLSAGFDKNGVLTDIMPAVGFGFAEVGSITAKRCEGNRKPRLWRLPKSKSLSVAYGLKNDGCEAIASRLRNKKYEIPVGANIAMTNCADNLVLQNAVRDYATAFKTIEPTASYITLNISCPNAHGGQPFITPYKLDYLLDILDEIPTKKPVFVKLSPDLSHDEIDGILDIIHHHRVHGIICSNLTKKRDMSKLKDSTIPERGGLSGKAVQELSDETLSYIYRREGKRYVLVGCGGVFTAEDAYKKIRLGASLVQMITGMIFEGPQVISQINQRLAELLKRDGFTSIKNAVGIDNCIQYE